MSGAGGRAILAGQAAVRFKGDRGPLTKAMKGAERDLANFASKVNAIGTGLAAAGAAITGALILPVRDFARIEQLLGRFSAVFRDLEKEATNFAEGLGTKINQSALDIRDQLAQFQSVLLGLGFEDREAFELSRQLTELSQDLVAFDDTITSTQESTDKFLSAIAGEVRPARRIGGADIRQTALDAFLLEKGLAKSADAATEAQRALARITIVSQAAGRAGITGQAEREVNTLAALFRAFKARILDLNFAIGRALAPQITELTKNFNALISRIENYVTNNAEAVVQTAKLGVVMTGLGLSLKIVAAAAGTAAKSLAALRTAAAALLTGKIGAIIGAIGLAFIGLVASSEEGRAAVIRAFDGITERIAASRDAVLNALEAGQYVDAVKVVALSIEGEVLRLAREFGNIGLLVAAWFEESIRVVRSLSQVLVSVVTQVVSLINGALGKIDETLLGGQVAGLEAALQERLNAIEREIEQINTKATKKIEEADGLTDEERNRRINQAKSKFLEQQLAPRLRQVSLRRTLGPAEFQAIGSAIATAIVKEGGLPAKNLAKQGRSVERAFQIFVSNLRRTADLGRKKAAEERAEKITELQSQAQAIKEAFRTEAAATFGGATRLAFGIGESRVDEDQLDELVKINEQLGKLGVGPAVIINNGT